jgi:hypothetical protein
MQGNVTSLNTHFIMASITFQRSPSVFAQYIFPRSIMVSRSSGDEVVLATRGRTRKRAVLLTFFFPLWVFFPFLLFFFLTSACSVLKWDTEIFWAKCILFLFFWILPVLASASRLTFFFPSSLLSDKLICLTLSRYHAHHPPSLHSSTPHRYSTSIF